MAITSQGYDGEVHEIDEVGWAGISGSFGSDYSLRGLDGAADENAGRVTTVSSAERTVAIAPATFYGHGVRDRSDSTINVQLPVVAEGQARWFLVAVRRDWQANATVVSAIPDPQASAVIPSQRLNTPGVQDDQPLALVQVTGGQSIPTAVVDLRCWSGNAGLVAASTGALGYLGRLGSRVTVGDTVWTRSIDSAGSLAWSPAHAGGKKSRFLNITASGALNGAVDIVPPQPVPASPFGNLGFQATVTASISTRMSAGRGAVLELLYDGISFAEDRASNDGVASALITLSATLPVFVDAGVAHTFRARLTSLAGEITVYQVGYVLIEAEPRGAL